MSILIKGMEMPTSCAECFNRDCELWREVKRPAYQRHIYCPLVPIPPHGRLVDADVLKRELVLDYAYAAADMVDDAHTIIPAEEEDVC